MMQKFSAKEIHFLKSGSDQDPVHPPETYFSDLIHTPSVQYQGFAPRLAKAVKSRPAFICAVIQVDPKAGEETRETAKEIFEACFTAILDQSGQANRGIWESLDDTAFALAFWDYDKEKDGIRLLSLLRDKISERLKEEILMGIAAFPCQDLGRDKIMNNALKAIDHAAFFGPGHMISFDAVSLNISGDRLFQLEQYEAALAEYETGLTLAPKDINLINSLGVTHGIMDQLDKALECFEQASDINPKEVMVIYNMGLIHRIRENEGKAVHYLKKAHGINPDIFEIELLLGHLLFKQERFEQALAHIDAALSLNPESGTPYRLKGQILLDRDNPAEAGTLFHSAVKYSPNDSAALYGYARAMALQEKNLSIALSFAKKSLALDPGNTTYQELLEEIQAISEQAAAQNRDTAIKSA